MAIPQCYCLLNSSICASDISRLAPPRPIKIFFLFFLLFFFIFFSPGCNDRWSAHKTSRLHVGHPQAPSQVWSNWSWNRLPPRPGLGSSLLPSHWAASLFVHIQLWEYFPPESRPRMENHPIPSAKQPWEVLTWRRWDPSPIFSLCWDDPFSAKEDVVKGSHPVGASDMFQLLLFSFG